MRYLMIALLYILIPSAGFAQTPEDFYNNGNRAFLAGDYDTAIKLYGQTGVENGALFYNMGNAWLLKGQTGKAILYYRRALKLMPRDTDIRHNLEQARNLRERKLERKYNPEKPGFLSALYRLLTINELAAGSLALLTLFGVILLFYMNRREPRASESAGLKPALVVTGILCLVQLLFTGIKTYRYIEDKTGVIIKSEVSAFAEPSANSPEVLKIHDGAEVIVAETENGFFKIILPTGWTGWVPATSLEII
jgi:tetratricopeptide (TPR) repeat protein